MANDKPFARFTTLSHHENETIGRKSEADDDVTLLEILVPCAVLMFGLIIFFSYLIKKDNETNRLYLRRKIAVPNEYVTANELGVSRRFSNNDSPQTRDGVRDDALNSNTRVDDAALSADGRAPTSARVFSVSSIINQRNVNQATFHRTNHMESNESASHAVPTRTYYAGPLNPLDLYTYVNRPTSSHSTLTSQATCRLKQFVQNEPLFEEDYAESGNYRIVHCRDESIQYDSSSTSQSVAMARGETLKASSCTEGRKERIEHRFSITTDGATEPIYCRIDEFHVKEKLSQTQPDQRFLKFEFSET